MTDQRQTQQSESEASQLGSALDRVREMREHAEWPPLTDPANIQQRAERVGEVRKQITIPPLAGERDLHPRRFPWLQQSMRPFVYGTFAVIFFGLLLGLLLGPVLEAFLPEVEPVVVPLPEPAMIAFPLPEHSSYMSLTEPEAIRFGKRALALVAQEPHKWYLDRHHDVRRPEAYMGRVSDYEGVVKFVHAKDFSAVLYVGVKVDAEAQCVLCIIHP